MNLMQACLRLLAAKHKVVVLFAERSAEFLPAVPIKVMAQLELLSEQLNSDELRSAEKAHFNTWQAYGRTFLQILDKSIDRVAEQLKIMLAQTEPEQKNADALKQLLNAIKLTLNYTTSLLVQVTVAHSEAEMHGIVHTAETDLLKSMRERKYHLIPRVESALLKLPDEILLNILEYLTLTEFARLRRTNAQVNQLLNSQLMFELLVRNDSRAQFVSRMFDLKGRSSSYEQNLLHRLATRGQADVISSFFTVYRKKFSSQQVQKIIPTGNPLPETHPYQIILNVSWYSALRARKLNVLFELLSHPDLFSPADSAIHDALRELGASAMRPDRVAALELLEHITPSKRLLLCLIRKNTFDLSVPAMKSIFTEFLDHDVDSATDKLGSNRVKSALADEVEMRIEQLELKCKRITRVVQLCTEVGHIHIEDMHEKQELAEIVARLAGGIGDYQEALKILRSLSEVTVASVLELPCGRYRFSGKQYIRHSLLALLSEQLPMNTLSDFLGLLPTTSLLSKMISFSNQSPSGTNTTMMSKYYYIGTGLMDNFALLRLMLENATPKERHAFLMQGDSFFINTIVSPLGLANMDADGNTIAEQLFALITHLNLVTDEQLDTLCHSDEHYINEADNARKETRKLELRNQANLKTLVDLCMSNGHVEHSALYAAADNQSKLFRLMCLTLNLNFSKQSAATLGAHYPMTVRALLPALEHADLRQFLLEFVGREQLANLIFAEPHSLYKQLQSKYRTTTMVTALQFCLELLPVKERIQTFFSQLIMGNHDQLTAMLTTIPYWCLLNVIDPLTPSLQNFSLRQQQVDMLHVVLKDYAKSHQLMAIQTDKSFPKLEIKVQHRDSDSIIVINISNTGLISIFNKLSHEVQTAHLTKLAAAINEHDLYKCADIKKVEDNDQNKQTTPQLMIVMPGSNHAKNLLVALQQANVVQRLHLVTDLTTMVANPANHDVKVSASPEANMNPAPSAVPEPAAGTDTAFSVHSQLKPPLNTFR